MPRTKPHPTQFNRFRLDFGPMRTRRRQLNLTQRQLAAAAGVHSTTVYRTERNKSEPTFSQMVSMARALGTPLSMLVQVRDLDVE